MRLLCNIAVCLFVLLLCASGASTATRGIQKYAAARNASDGLLRLETNVADEPNRLQPQDSVADKANDEHREQEERVGMTVEPWTSSAGHFLESNELLLRQKMHLNRALAPSTHDEEIETVFARVNLQQWLSKSHKPDHVEAFPVASGSVLITNGRGGGVAKVFLWLRGFTHQKDFAEMWQRILLAHYPETLPLVSEVWLKSGLSPTEAYRMMPVSAKKTYGWLDVHRTTNDWIDYVDKYRSLGHDYSDSQVARVLANDRHANTLEEIFNWLRITPSKKDGADRMQKG
ncbi:unnamed protein product [Hyaloperonospora brassicae]|uniref:RxLR effector candidate protein n=1 Tax=Hyaloperonospora brassicae TaxID=162125 RepID=A0AAV0UPZ4_HYABA|nr:unnamed protein product [Hyaloperonospora brassicae]